MRILLIALIFTYSGHALGALKWKNMTIVPHLKLGGDYVDNKQVEARVFALDAYINLNIPWSETVELQVKAGAALETGSNNSFIIDEYAPRRQWSLYEAFVSYTPFQFLDFKVGAVNQGEFDSPLLVTKTAYLSAMEVLNIPFSENHKVYLKLQQAIPNNLNLTQRIGVLESGTPTYMTQTIGADLNGDLFALKLEGTRFEYQDLSTGVAFQSQFLGNSIRGGSALNSAFIYGFKGYNLAGRVRFIPFDSIGLEFSGQYLFNDKAPEQRNTGTLLTGGVLIGNWTVEAQIFENQSDSSPGFYNSNFYSHNNHEGGALGLKYKNEQDGVEARFFYVDSSPIAFNAFQSDTKKVIFSIDQQF